MIWLNYHTELLRQFLWNLLRAVAVFSAVFALLSLQGEGGDWGDLSWPSVRVLVLSMLDRALPLALLVATLFTVGPRAHFKELTALTAAGFSMIQIMWPVLGVGVLATGYSIALRLARVTLGALPTLSQPAEETAFHAMFAYPMANLFAVTAGIILASSPRRKSVYGGFLTALLFIFAFNVVTSGAHALGRHGMLPQVLAG